MLILITENGQIQLAYSNMKINVVELKSEIFNKIHLQKQHLPAHDILSP